jgi:hypothetical protein
VCLHPDSSEVGGEDVEEEEDSSFYFAFAKKRK